MSAEINAQELMLQVGLAYSLLESYQDTGYVESLDAPGTADENQSRLTFSTFFRRPNLFRFEWNDRLHDKSPGETSTIWCDGKQAYSQGPWNDRASIGKGLSQCVTRATGVSRGTAQNISALLMSEIGGRRVTDLGSFESLGTELFAGEPCYRLHHDAPHETDLWISTSRSIILKIFEQYWVGDGPDPAEWLRSNRFKSFAAFFRWLRFRHDFAQAVVPEPFHVIEQTHYTSVVLNAQIPDVAFTLAGLKGEP
jgi:hypothetical protein